MSAVVEQWADEVAPQVLTKLQAARLPITPKRVIVTTDIDGLDEEAFRILLVLPAPAGDTWDREAIFRARRAAIRALDEAAAAAGETLPGRTIALVTTDEADEADTAPPEFPVAGEGRTA